MSIARQRRKRTDRVGEGSAEHVVAYVRDLIERKRLRPGDQLPPERDLAARIGVSRPTLRMGLHALAAMGCVQSRHGSGTFIREGPPALGTEPLSLLAALHDFTHAQMYEARRILEVGAAGLAAESATPEQVASLAEEAASLFSAMGSAAVPRTTSRSRRLRWPRATDHRGGRRDGLGATSKQRRRPRRGVRPDPRDAAESHREIYQAIRRRDAHGARSAMNEHLLKASAYQEQEREKLAVPPARARRASGL
jgi:GntR family transcriptional repressor for pyruvate dehydrogenase complex